MLLWPKTWGWDLAGQVLLPTFATTLLSGQDKPAPSGDLYS